MKRQWSVGRVLRYAVVALTLTGVFLAMAHFGTRASDLITVSSGPALDPPRDEPGETVGDTSSLSTPEILLLYEQHSLWQRGIDTTRSFDVSSVVHPDHSVTVTEEIVQVFRTDRHGIERLIPLDTNLGHNVMRDLVVSTDTTTPSLTEVTDVQDGVRVRIGDPDTTIRGAHAYRLTYVLENVVTTDESTAFVRLDAVNDWRQDIDSLTYRIAAPGAPTSVACFAGPAGSVTPCAVASPTPDGGTYALKAALPAGHSFTAEVSYPSTTFDPIATVTATDGTRQLALLAGAGVMAALLVAYGITVVRAAASRRDAATLVGLTFDPPSQSTLPMRSTRGTPESMSVITDSGPPLEFVPPLRLDPASIARLRDGTDAAAPTMLAATLVDLAADGVVRLEQRARDHGWTVHRVAAPPRPVNAHEMTMLTALLGKKDSRDLETSDKSLSSTMTRFVHQVDEHLHELGLTTKKKLHVGVETRWYPLMVTALSCLLVAFVGGVTFAVVVATTDMKWGILGMAAVAALTVLGMGVRHDVVRVRNYTDRGRGAVWRIGGFERFFHDSEAVHAQAAGRMGIYREYMGYAVAFAAVHDWVGAMPDDLAELMGDEVPPAALGSIAYRRVWRRTAAHAVKASASSRGGGSSGSSSSGGGFGGGGGGSW